MLDNPANKKFTIHSFDQYWLPKNILALWSFNINSIAMVSM